MLNNLKTNINNETFCALSNDLINYGLAEGFILYNIRHWIRKNKANNKHFYDGKYWTYNSVSAFSKLFPFLSENKIQRALKNLESKGILLVGNYNKVNYDRTKWFSINEENDLKLNSDTIHQNQQMHSSNLTNPFGENDEPIPYINTNINTDNISSTNCSNKESGEEQLEERFLEFYNAYPRRLNKTKTRICYYKALTLTTPDVILKGVENYKKYIKLNKTEERFIKHPTTWLNQGCWEDEYNFSNSSSNGSTQAKELPEHLRKDLLEMTREELDEYYRIVDGDTESIYEAVW